MKFFEFVSENRHKFFRGFLFLLSVIVVVYLYPRQGKFRYEFQKGYPWKHENLIAPYNFPIYKPDKIITEEKDSINDSFKPYFKYNDKIAELQITQLKSDFNLRFNDKYLNDSISKIKPKWYQNAIKEKYNLNINHLIELLQYVYTKGIVENSEVFDNLELSARSIMVVKHNVANEYLGNQFFTLRTAYEYILKNMFSEKITPDKSDSEFIKLLNLNDYMVPNITYDPETSEKIKKSMIDNISLTHGMVQSGERIIFKGEVVDDQKFDMLMSLKREYESSLSSKTNRIYILLGQVIFIFTAFMILFLFILNFRREILRDYSKTLFILILVIFYIALSVLVQRSSQISLYIIPFAIVPITIKTFYDARMALFVHLITIMLVGFLAPNGFEFLFLQFTSGVVVIISLQKLYKRGQLFASAGIVIFTYSFVYFGIAITQEGDISDINWQNFEWFAGNGVLVLLAYPMIYIFEKSFGFLSDVTLIELSDSNQPLLRKLAQEAPGTFQHSMQVANIAEEVVYHIGGNPLLVRAGALYHDIGKISMPLFYIENQISGVNPHNQLEFDRSAEIIISHVAHGVELAHKYKLPVQIIDFIRTHHGTTKVQYFYKSYVNKFPDRQVDMDIFMYHGPSPHTKETAVLMMTDSVEAAARSLKVYTKQTINELVDNIINNQLKEEQFDQSNITFINIVTIRRILKEKLQNIYHTRIEYPK